MDEGEQTKAGERSPAQRWLLLVHQLPTKPAYFRVKIWRRLQGIGAVAVKSTVYALPANAETQEDFEWLLKEIVEGGGEAMVCEARLLDGLSDAQIEALFNSARDADYAEIAQQLRSVIAQVAANPATGKRAEGRSHLGRVRKSLGELVAIDFFGAPGRLAVEGLLGELERRVAEDQPVAERPSKGS